MTPSLKLITKDVMLDNMCTSNKNVHYITTIVHKNGHNIAIIELNKKDY